MIGFSSPKVATPYPDLTDCDFFFRGYEKDRVYIPPLDRTGERIRVVLTTVSQDMFTNV
jgi:hypothetical protein